MRVSQLDVLSHFYLAACCCAIPTSYASLASSTHTAEHLMVQHHVTGQLMVKYDNAVPAGGQSVANNGAVAVPIPNQAGRFRWQVSHRLPAGAGLWGWSLTSLLPERAAAANGGVKEETSIYSDDATATMISRGGNCNRRWCHLHNVNFAWTGAAREVTCVRCPHEPPCIYTVNRRPQRGVIVPPNLVTPAAMSIIDEL